jgi:hypothetical protein
MTALLNRFKTDGQEFKDFVSGVAGNPGRLWKRRQVVPHQLLKPGC